MKLGLAGRGRAMEMVLSGECVVRGESHRLYLIDLLDHVRWGCQKKPRSLVSKDREIGSEYGIVGCPRRGLEDVLECHIRLFRKHAKKCFATFHSAEIAGMTGEEAVAFLSHLKQPCVA